MVFLPRSRFLPMLAAMLLVGPQMDAAVLLSTDFTGRTVTGATASNLIYTLDGFADPGDLTAVRETPETNSTFGGLFDAGNSAGHFAVDRNTGNEGPWSVTMTLSLTTAAISLESVDVDWQHFNNSGAFQGPGRRVGWTITVTGSSSGLIGTASDFDGAVSGVKNIAFASPLALNNSETYDLRIFVDNNGDTQGNNTGFDALTLNGTIIPEPSSILLAGLGGLVLLRRRR